MFLNFIAINDKMLNLNSVALVEDQTPTDADGNPTRDAVAVITTLYDAEITLEGEDATALFDRLELIAHVNDMAVAQASNVAQGGQP